MYLIERIRNMAETRARARKIYAELSTMSDRELDDLNLSRARLPELSNQFARQA